MGGKPTARPVGACRLVRRDAALVFRQAHTLEPVEPDPHSPPGFAADADAVAQRPAAPAGQLLSPLSVLGIIALVGCLVCTGALLVRGQGQGDLLLGLVSAGCGLIGAWLLAWGRSWKLAIPLALLGLGLAALAFSLRMPGFGWPSVGLGLGALGAWSYARRQRALIATCTLLAAGYAVAAAAGLLMAMGGQGHWVIAAQGLGSLVLGGLLLRLASSDADAAAADRAPPRSDHARLRIAGRLLVVCGILLPYAALVLLAVGRAIEG